MANSFQSSFIPKGVGGYVPTETTRRGSTGLFGVLALLLFLGVLLLTVGVIGYKQVVKSSITDLKSELALAEESVDVSTIDKMFAFSKKLSASREVVVKHKVVTNFLSLLADNTVQTVSFNELSYRFLPTGELSISLSGIAPNYATLALQGEAMSKLKEVKSADFSELSSTEGGRISFKVTLLVEPSVAVYSPNVSTGSTTGGAVKSSEDVSVTGLEEIDTSMPNFEDL